MSGSIFDISPNAKNQSLPVTPIVNASVERDVEREYSIAGFTCIEGDILTKKLTASLRPGDALAYGNVGSYSIVMRPSFILPSSPILMLDRQRNGFELIKERQSNTSVFDLFCPN